MSQHLMRIDDNFIAHDLWPQIVYMFCFCARPNIMHSDPEIKQNVGRNVYM